MACPGATQTRKQLFLRCSSRGTWLTGARLTLSASIANLIGTLFLENDPEGPGDNVEVEPQ